MHRSDNWSSNVERGARSRCAERSVRSSVELVSVLSLVLVTLTLLVVFYLRPAILSQLNASGTRAFIRHHLTMSTDEELPPSKLGTKEYWDKVYEREVGVFEDTGDEGEVWFGERAMEKMRDWVYANCPPEQEVQAGNKTQKRRIRAMECGCGAYVPPRVNHVKLTLLSRGHYC